VNCGIFLQNNTQNVAAFTQMQRTTKIGDITHDRLAGMLHALSICVSKRQQYDSCHSVNTTHEWKKTETLNVTRLPCDICFCWQLAWLLRIAWHLAEVCLHTGKSISFCRWSPNLGVSVPFLYFCIHKQIRN